MEEVKGRYVFPGNLKLPVGIIKSNDINDKHLSQLFIVLDEFRDRCISNVVYNRRSCCPIELDSNKTLYIDYNNGFLNFYIKNIDKHEIGQHLSLNDCERIVRRESTILQQLYYYSNFELLENKKKDLLLQTLVHSAYNLRTQSDLNRKIFVYDLAKDFELTR